MTDVIHAFCSYWHVYHNTSHERAKVQERLLRRLEASLDGRGITSLTAPDLERFLVGLDVAPGTTLKHLKMIRPFVRWCHENGHMTADQYLAIKGVRAPRGAGWSPPRPYSRGEINGFWKAFDLAYPWTDDDDPYDRTPKRAEYWVARWQENPDPWEWERVRPYARRLQAEAILSLALFGGLRRIEILNLTIEDCHYDNAFVRVHGAAKNPAALSQPRAVPMTETMRVALANWLEFREQVLAPEHDTPWLCLVGGRALEPMSMSTLGHLLGKVGNGYSLHRMRHTFATERLRSDMPVEILQSALGHSTIGQTLAYAQIGDEDVIRVADKTNTEFEAALARPEQE